MTTTTPETPIAMTVEDLAELGAQLRVDSIRIADRAGSGHPTSSMSAADLIAVLVANHLRFDPDRPDALGNDHLVFSKGHATPLLYAAFKAMGMADDDALADYRSLGSPYEGHPTPRLPGVPVATGSLGLGLPMGVGLAMAARDLDRTDARTWVLCGDSEMAEGSMWEAVDHAGWAELANLVAIVDVNRLGQTGPTRHGWDLAAYADRFAANGWHTEQVDGHDPEAIDDALQRCVDDPRPSAVVAHTHKGSGADETDDERGKHGKPLADPGAAIDELGGYRQRRVRPRAPEIRSSSLRDLDPSPLDLPRWDLGASVATRDGFGAGLAALAHSRPDVVSLDGEVGDSTRLAQAADAAPDRFFQMYIAEQLMAAAATGIQVSGWRPVAATFASFWSRAADVLRMATISGAQLVAVGSHAGVSIGEDGPSQMGLEDLALMRSLYASTVVYPCDANQTAALLVELIDRAGITYLRTTRGDTPVIYPAGTPFPIGGSHVLRSSDADHVAVIAAGVTVHEALRAADQAHSSGLNIRVIDAYSVKPIDAATITAAIADCGRIVVAEDHRPEGGLGEAVLSAVAGGAPAFSYRHLAVDTMPGSADPAAQRHEAGIDATAIAAAAEGLAATG